MTQTSGNLTKPQLTRNQAAALEQYRRATDFSAYLLAIAALNGAGLYEADATKAIAVSYITKEESE